MNTAVQLRVLGDVDHPRCDILYGRPFATVSGELGPVALFAAAQIVAYRLRSLRRPRLFVFRTLDVLDPLASAVPGVWPRVQLLLVMRSSGRVRRARRLFAYLVTIGREPSALTDAFYLRVGLMLAGHAPALTVLPSLLRTMDSEVHRSRLRGQFEALPTDSTSGSMS